MASGLSVESQLKTLLVAIIAPIVGFLADRLGVGMALAVAGMMMLVLFFIVKLNPPENTKNIEEKSSQTAD